VLLARHAGGWRETAVGSISAHAPPHQPKGDPKPLYRGDSEDLLLRGYSWHTPWHRVVVLTSPIKADGPPERAFLVSGLDCCYGPLTWQKQYSSTSPFSRKCSLSIMRLWPPTKDR